MDKGIVGAGLAAAAMLLVVPPAWADNYHYHELITRDSISRYTAWTGYPGHAPTMSPAYDPAALGLTVLVPDSQGRGVIDGSESSTTPGNAAFCAGGNCGTSSWVDTLTWEHTFAGVPDAEAIRWVRFEIDLFQEPNCGSSGSGCGGHDKDKDKNDKHEGDKDSGSAPGAYSFAGLIDFTSLDLTNPGTQLEMELAGAGVKDELRDHTGTSGQPIHLDYKEFSYVGLPISAYLDADLVFDGNPFTFGVTLESTGKFCVVNSEFIVDYIPSPVPEPGTLLLLGSGLAGVGFLRRRH